jgi:hypothetical protein
VEGPIAAENTAFGTESNRENHYLAGTLTLVPEARLWARNLPACGLIPLL